MKRSKKRMMILCAVVAVLLAAGGLFGANYLRSVQDYQAKVSSITFSNVDISRVPNGTYIGECDVDFIYAKVEVTVQEGVITDIIILEHRNERGAAAEDIINSILAEQTVDVDVVASATNSSIVIKKAVENALLSAR